MIVTDFTVRFLRLDARREGGLIMLLDLIRGKLQCVDGISLPT